jgi:hypothetical protein
MTHDWSLLRASFDQNSDILGVRRCRVIDAVVNDRSDAIFDSV